MPYNHFPFDSKVREHPPHHSLQRYFIDHHNQNTHSLHPHNTLRLLLRKYFHPIRRDYSPHPSNLFLLHLRLLMGYPLH